MHIGALQLHRRISCLPRSARVHRYGNFHLYLRWCKKPFLESGKWSSCNSSPCQPGTECVSVSPDSFTCICSNTTDASCERNKYEVPSFSGYSYIRLQPLKAYHKLSIEIEFMSYSDNGILLYDQQRSDGRGDFVSLALIDGFVEFRYNLGSGLALLTSPDKVELSKYHKVVVKRYHRDGILKMDEAEEVAGQSKGWLRALDLSEDSFLGHVPTSNSRWVEKVNTRFPNQFS